MYKPHTENPDGAREKVKGPKGPTLSAEVLFSYPSDKPLDNAALIADFCFPAGVQPRLLERTPSMSSLNQVIYRQSCSDRDDRSFVFVLAVQAADRLPLYGVCVYVDEFVFLPPPISGDAVPASRLGLSRHVVAAPRCYCLLSHYPFFPLHFQVSDRGNHREVVFWGGGGGLVRPPVLVWGGTFHPVPVHAHHQRFDCLFLSKKCKGAHYNLPTRARCVSRSCS